MEKDSDSEGSSGEEGGVKKRWIAIFVLGLGLFGLGFVGGAVVNFVQATRELAALLPQKVGNKLNEFHGTYVTLGEISSSVSRAVIVSQDRRFETNLGVDFGANVRALYYMAVRSERQGASTITEQLAKNAYYNDVDSLRTDVWTKVLALFITNKFSKPKILEMYLNVIYYGRGAYGIKRASEVYFETEPGELALWQSAYLAGLINAPGYFDKHPDQAKAEAKIILEELVQQKAITLDDYDRAQRGLGGAN